MERTIRLSNGVIILRLGYDIYHEDKEQIETTKMFMEWR